MRRGPKAKENVVSMPGRSRERLADDLSGEPVKPAWLNPLAADVWDAHAAALKARGVALRGHESGLAQWAALEAELIGRRRDGKEVPAALIAQHRVWCCEFFSTPAAARGRVADGPTTENPFARCGRRPLRGQP